jgi:hypothetical protein
MFTSTEPFLSAEVDYRRERAMQAMAGSRSAPRSIPRAARPVRRTRHRARTVAHYLVTGH